MGNAREEVLADRRGAGPDTLCTGRLGDLRNGLRVDVSQVVLEAIVVHDDDLRDAELAGLGGDRVHALSEDEGNGVAACLVGCGPEPRRRPFGPFRGRVRCRLDCS